MNETINLHNILQADRVTSGRSRVHDLALIVMIRSVQCTVVHVRYLSWLAGAIISTYITFQIILSDLKHNLKVEPTEFLTIIWYV